MQPGRRRGLAAEGLVDGDMVASCAAQMTGLCQRFDRHAAEASARLRSAISQVAQQQPATTDLSPLVAALTSRCDATGATHVAAAVPSLLARTHSTLYAACVMMPA